jgi:hypothetical protein
MKNKLISKFLHMPPDNRLRTTNGTRTTGLKALVLGCRQALLLHR